MKTGKKWRVRFQSLLFGRIFFFLPFLKSIIIMPLCVSGWTKKSFKFFELIFVFIW